MDGATQALLEQHQALIAAACEQGRQQLLRAGIDGALMPMAEQFRFQQQADPYTQQPTLNGQWGESHGQRRAQLVINADGSLLLECDLLCPHPAHSGRWAEQVSIWGRSAEVLKSEISLLAQIEE